MAKTGFEKFLSKQNEEVELKPVANTVASVTPSVKPIEKKDERLVVKKDETGLNKPEHQKGPAKAKVEKGGRGSEAVINIVIDIQLREILDSLKYKIGCKTVKGVILEGIKLLLKKYNIDYNMDDK